MTRESADAASVRHLSLHKEAKEINEAPRQPTDGADPTPIPS
jgi:hypothetical protein